MGGAVAALLGDGSRLHLQHGPIDLVIGVDAATPAGRQGGFGAAARRFDTILTELVNELPLLRDGVTPGSAMPEGQVARRMMRAARPHLAQFVTPMAAVAGAVADEVLAAILAHGPVHRAHVNNGGDIALHLGPGREYAAVIAGLDGAEHGRVTIAADTPARGIATSGRGGRSLSLGIADNVTVLARSAAGADVAATLIANAVDLPGHGAITRAPAREIDPDSDLGGRAAVIRVGPLSGNEVDRALEHGALAARAMCGQGLILGAALFLRGAQRIVGSLPRTPITQTKRVNHA